MLIESYREQFSLLLFDKNSKKGTVTQDFLIRSGYSIKKRDDFSQWTQEQALENPPHMILLQLKDVSDIDEEMVERVKKWLPEVKIIALCVPEFYHSALEFEGFDQVIIYPYSKGLQLIKTLDHALQSLYQIYQNEHLVEVLKGEVSSQDSVVTQTEEKVEMKPELKFLQEAKNETQLSKLNTRLLRTIYEASGSNAYCFQVYWGSKKCVIHQGQRSQMRGNDGLGYSFQKLSSFEDLVSCRELKTFAKEVLKTQKYVLFIDEGEPLIQEFVLINRSEGQDYDFSLLFDTYYLLRRALKFSEVSYKHFTQEAFGCLSEKELDYHLRQEISRSRRISIPVSLVLLKIDSWSQELFSKSEQFLVFRSLVQLVKQKFRLTDSVYYLSNGTFGVLLPHTNSKGASIAGERIRQLVQKYNFDKYTEKNITISLGISEYPEMGLDGDDLKKIAFEALDIAAEKYAGNKVVIGAAPLGFQAESIEFKEMRDLFKLNNTD